MAGAVRQMNSWLVSLVNEAVGSDCGKGAGHVEAHLVKAQKKNLKCRLYCIQNDMLCNTVPTKQSVNQYKFMCWDILWEVPNFDGLVWKVIWRTQRRISQPHILILIYWLLCWYPVAKPVIFNTMKPLFENICFRPKGWLGRFSGYLWWVQMKSN
jgi:hypothetical protein